jgi:large subunit ribosomal protein L29
VRVLALLKTKDIRAMDDVARRAKLKELREELMHERGVAAMGGAPPSPGKIRALRKNVARILTVLSHEAQAAAVPGAPPAAPVAGGETPREPGEPRGRKAKAERPPAKERGDGEKEEKT